jgi:asparagine synthase (glutamine-hydrolysing)
MCGIAGLIAELSSEALRERISRMTRLLAHRGPDADGVFVDGSVALGHRRLSIQDLSQSGAQPMSLFAGGPTISYNGEVYNFRELRSELSTLGHQFKGHSDTEVMLHAYQQWGEAGLARFEGIFAFALWDPRLQRLILMRDRLGVKPLFFAWSSNGLAFGSEIKAVLAADLSDRTIDQQALSEYLWFGTAFEDRTILNAVRSLQPGQRLLYEAGKVRLDYWWRIEQWLSNPAFNGSEADAAVAIRSALDGAVARQLVADVPVGIFLSGGIDSSGIAAAAMQVSSAPLASFSVGFDFDGGVNELPKARQVASALGLEHHEMVVAGDDLEEVLIKLAQAHDEPFADVGNIPLYLLARSLKGQIKVVLQGDGGDELFAGYRRYAILANAHWWRRVPAMAIAGAKRFNARAGERFGRMAQAAGQDSAALRMALLLTTETLDQRPERFFMPEALARLQATNPFQAYEQAALRFREYEPVQQMLLTDLTTQLPAQFLPKVDRATMAFGLEARVPLLDEQVARIAVGLPWQWKTRGAQKKIVLRQALRGRVSNATLDGPKVGFGVPYEHWLRTSLHGLAREHVLDSTFCERFGLSVPLLSAAFDEHRAGSKEHGFILWKLLQLGLWARHCG